MSTYWTWIGLGVTVFFLICMVMDRMTSRMQPAYRERERSMFVIQLVLFIIFLTAVLAGVGIVKNKVGDVLSVQPQEPIFSASCFMPFLILIPVGLMIVFFNALKSKPGEWADHKDRLRKREPIEAGQIQPVQNLKRTADPITTWQEPEKNHTNELVQEIKDRQKRIRLKNFEKRWQRSLRHGTQLQRPFDMSDREWYSRPVWTSDDIYQWLKERQE